MADADVVSEADLADDEEIADASGYRPLVAWLAEQVEDDVPVDFDHVEEVLGAPLPAAARTSASLWHDPEEPLFTAAAAAGFRPVGIDLTDERVTFSRLQAPDRLRRGDAR